MKSKRAAGGGEPGRVDQQETAAAAAMTSDAVGRYRTSRYLRRAGDGRADARDGPADKACGVAAVSQVSTHESPRKYETIVKKNRQPISTCEHVCADWCNVHHLVGLTPNGGLLLLLDSTAFLYP